MKALRILAVCILCLCATQALSASIPKGEPDSGEEMRWLVIFGSYRLGDTDNAERRLLLVRLHGCGEARIQQSDEYPNLRPGLLIVVAGPYAKQPAAQLAEWLGKLLPEKPYIKSYR